MMKVLVTGFDAFDGESINPAYEVVKGLKSEIFGASIHKVEVPTVFYKSTERVLLEIDKHEPDVVIAIGQSGGSTSIAIERVAINFDDARIADNEGQQPVEKTIIENGENAYFSTLPVKKIVEGLKVAGVPSTESLSAGTFVCNHLMYGILHHLKIKDKKTLAGFIHIPYLHKQVIDKPNTASMSLDTLIEAIEKAIEIVINEMER